MIEGVVAANGLAGAKADRARRRCGLRSMIRANSRPSTTAWSRHVEVPGVARRPQPATFGPGDAGWLLG